MTSNIKALQDEITKLKGELNEKREKCADSRLLNFVGDIPSLGRSTIRCRRVLRGHLAKIHAFDWDKNSENIVSASQDGKLIIWNSITTLKCSAIPLKSSWVMTCAFSPTGNFIACGGLDNICTIYDMMGNEAKPRIKREFDQHQGYISSCVFLNDSQIISASGDSTCILWDIENNKKVVSLLGHSADVMKICMKPDDPNIMATGSCDRSGRIWDIRSKSPCVQYFTSHTDDINSITFHPCGTAVATASDDGTCKMFDLTADNEIASFSFESGGNKVCCTDCSFSLSGRVLFVGQDDHSISIRDTLKGDVLGKLAEHDNRISCLRVSPNGFALCTGSWDNTLKIFA